MRGQQEVKDYSVVYARAYQKMLAGMVARRMRSAIRSIGSYWYSAWVDAGQPDLDKLIRTPMDAAAKRKIAQEEALYRNGK